MQSTLDRVRDSLDPQTVTNAVYEVMLKWLDADEKLGDSPRSSRPIIQGKRQAYEEVLSMFFGVRPKEVRAIMRKHYGRNGDGNDGGDAETTGDAGGVRSNLGDRRRSTPW